MSHRFLFYQSGIPADPESIELTGDENHHLSRVLRISRGETVFVTDGCGRIFECRVGGKGTNGTVLEVAGLERDDRVLRRVILALGVIKKDRFERAVEQCTELGMTDCIPFVSSNSRLKEFPSAFQRRLSLIALSAMKQSFRSILPRIAGTVDFDGMLESIEGKTVIVGEQEAPLLATPPPRGDIAVVIGPEAGFSEEERKRLESLPCFFASASPARLRSETAAAAMLARLHSQSDIQAPEQDVDKPSDRQ
jgi:16S rRNA (uracil1498-N3)-methyltransferase